ncbi:hypothetical protein M4I32_02340 [Microbacterium sp. LRZ72]|uniref:hypothetical protein n=1 Tax=Microbacterium sp. LRZ72 TaxID=2942481 RepID=UPI0029AB26AC|nr:hypothetical protein [Microbacterium sp. LRZ72]MDX2375636.1 hypothetical protein [Microbacterium sp. LRZ72]
MADDKPASFAMRVFSACLLLLLSVLALWLAVEVLAQFWGWLLLIAVVVALVGSVVWYARWRRDRGW